MFRKAARGFTLIELMIVVAIIGILAAIAIPNFLRYQLRSKSGEATVNVAAIKTNEIAYFGTHDEYTPATELPAAAAANVVTTRLPFVPAADGSDGWKELGWKPEGEVYFRYAVDAETTGATEFVVTAVSNLDGDADLQCWAYQQGTVEADGTKKITETPTNAACTNVGATAPFSEVYKASADGVY